MSARGQKTKVEVEFEINSCREVKQMVSGLTSMHTLLGLLSVQHGAKFAPIGSRSATVDRIIKVHADD